MSKQKVIKSKYKPLQLPIGGNVLTYLLYKDINPHGTLKGVLLTLAIAWWTIVWIIVIAQLWRTEPSDPVFEEKS